MGSRMLKRWLAFPLKSEFKINQRLENVSLFKSNFDLQTEIRSHLKQINDIERLISKVATLKINPRELLQLKNSMDVINSCMLLLRESNHDSLKTIADQLNSCDLLRAKISSALSDEPPVNVLKGNAIKSGFSEELDDFRKIAFSGHDFLNEMLEKESKLTNIPSLKIGSNNVYGYYIEVRHAHKNKVPEEWTRKQTLVNAERYITEELKVYEEKILTAEEKISTLEQQLFHELVVWTQDYIKIIQQNAIQIAQLDCLSGFCSISYRA